MTSAFRVVPAAVLLCGCLSLQANVEVFLFLFGVPSIAYMGYTLCEHMYKRLEADGKHHDAFSTELKARVALKLATDDKYHALSRIRFHDPMTYSTAMKVRSRATTVLCNLITPAVCDTGCLWMHCSRCTQQVERTFADGIESEHRSAWHHFFVAHHVHVFRSNEPVEALHFTEAKVRLKTVVKQ